MNRPPGAQASTPPCRFFTLVIACALVACSSPKVRWLEADNLSSPVCATSEVGEHRRDSSGVAIIEHRLPAGGYAPDAVLHPTVVTRILGRDSAGVEPFGRPMGAVLSSGLIVLADSLTSEIFLFDSTGGLVRRIGQRGEGPGDYNRLGSLFLLSTDTMAITDQKGGRITLLRPDASIARIGRVQGIPWDGEITAGSGTVPGLTTIVGRLPDGGFLATQRLIDNADPAGLKVGYPAERFGKGWLLQLNKDGSDAVRIGELRLEAWVFHSYEGGGLSSSPLLFSIPESVAGIGGHFWRSDGERFQVDQYEPRGEMRSSIRLCREPAPVSERELASAWRQWADGSWNPGWEMPPGTPVPTRHPSWRIQTFAPDSLLWLEEQSPPDSPRNWWVFRTDGTLHGIMQLPADRAVYSIANGRIVTVVAAGEEGEHVEVYAIPQQLRVPLSN